MQGLSAASLQSLCEIKWMLELRWGWHDVRSNTKIASMQGLSAASLQSLCEIKWMLELRWGWHDVRSNTKIAKSLIIGSIRIYTILRKSNTCSFPSNLIGLLQALNCKDELVLIGVNDLSSFNWQGILINDWPQTCDDWKPRRPPPPWYEVYCNHWPRGVVVWARSERSHLGKSWIALPK